MARHVIYIALIAYLILINIISFIIFAVDKRNATRGKWRVREITLIELTIVGGSIGGLIAMYKLRHKTQKMKFKIGVPVILVLQCILAIYMILNFL